eukprot:364849-Chlamydomonas_euryale.AAC.20
MHTSSARSNTPPAPPHAHARMHACMHACTAAPLGVAHRRPLLQQRAQLAMHAHQAAVHHMPHADRTLSALQRTAQS